MKLFLYCITLIFLFVLMFFLGLNAHAAPRVGTYVATSNTGASPMPLSHELTMMQKAADKAKLFITTKIAKFQLTAQNPCITNNADDSSDTSRWVCTDLLGKLLEHWGMKARKHLTIFLIPRTLDGYIMGQTVSQLGSKYSFSVAYVEDANEFGESRFWHGVTTVDHELYGHALGCTHDDSNCNIMKPDALACDDQENLQYNTKCAHETRRAYWQTLFKKPPTQLDRALRQSRKDSKLAS